MIETGMCIALRNILVERGMEEEADFVSEIIAGLRRKEKALSAFRRRLKERKIGVI